MKIKCYPRVFSQHFGNMTRPLELGIFASFYTKLGKNTPYNKNKNIKYFVYSTSYSSLTHKQILKSDLQSDLPFVVGAQKNPLIKMVLLSTHNICFAWEIIRIFFLNSTLSSHWEGTPADVDGQFFVEADHSAISADASTFSVCLGVIFAEFSDANACWRKSTSIFLLDSVFFSFFL